MLALVNSSSLFNFNSKLPFACLRRVTVNYTLSSTPTSSSSSSRRLFSRSSRNKPPSKVT